MNSEKYILVNTKVLPPIFEQVLRAKELLANKKASNTSEAIKMVGISRSAFYKYKDFVFNYTDNDNSIVNLSAVLSDKAGVFSALTAVLYKYGANIITVNQDVPFENTANVTLTIKTDGILISIDELIGLLKDVDGVISIKNIIGGKND